MIRTGLATLGLAFCLGHPVNAEGPGAEPRISVAVVGDINLDGLPGALVERGGDPFAPFAEQLAQADIQIGNLECVIATSGEPIPGKPYSFRAHPRTLIPLKRHFDAVSLANNHSGDFGPVAFAELLGHLDRNGIGFFGGGADLARAHRPLILERQGVRVALLGYNEFLPRSFEADHDRPGIAWSEDEQVRYDIVQARRQGADLVIPFMHWGWEHETLASPRQRRLARLMIDAGANAVIGTHPHVIQDTELYRGIPILYSLGNFVFDGFSSDSANTGWVLRLDLDRNGARAWRAQVARIDAQGIPHPASETDGTCWERGWAGPTHCAAH